MPTYSTVKKVAWGPIRDREIVEVGTNSDYNSPGSELVIPEDNYTYDVFRLFKNDSEVSDSDYTFKRPNKISLSSQSSDGDIYDIDRLVHISSDQVEYYIEQAEIFINQRLNNTYDVPFSSGSVPDEVKRLTEKLARAMIVLQRGFMDDYRPGEEEVNMAREQKQSVKKELKLLKTAEDEMVGEEADAQGSQAFDVAYLDDSQEDQLV